MLSKIKMRLRALIRRSEMESELDEELRHHIERQVEQNIRLGMNPEEARFAARKAFVGVEQAKELSRDARGVRWLEDLWQDQRYGARMLARNPGFTLVAALSLAVGIGANTAIFSLLDALLLRRLPVKQPEQLVVVATAAPGYSEPISSFSYPLFRALNEKNSVFAGMFAYAATPMSMSEGGRAEPVVGELVSGDFFNVLGVEPYMGRIFGEADNLTPGSSPVTVISYNFWRRRFAADPQIVGKTINLNGYPFTVVGVAAQGFNGVEVGVAPDVRIPIMMNGQVRPGSPPIEARGASWLSLMARLKPGASMKQAQAATDIAFQIAREPDVRLIRGDSPDIRTFKSLRIHIGSAGTGVSYLRRQFSQPLIVLMYLVGTVLLIACLNVANLLLARGVTRQKEIALRVALGAGRFRLMRQLLTEGVLLSALGGAAGLIIARLGTNALLGFLPHGRIPAVIELKPDLRMLGFTLGVTLLTGLLFNLAPALQATRPDLIPALKNETVKVSGGGHRWVLRRLLVILQVALSLALLVGAGLFARSLMNLKAVDYGYRAGQVVTLALDPSQNGYKLDRLRNFYSQLNERVSALPDVKSVTYTRNLPFGGGYTRIGIEVPDYEQRPDDEMAVSLNQVAPEFFGTFGVPLLQGRDFSAQDTPESAKVVIVNNSLARHFFGAENPLGKRISLETYKDLEIVGVVADAKYRTLKEAAPQTAYIPYQYGGGGQRTLCARATGNANANALITLIRNEVRSIDPNLPIFNVKTLAEQIDESVSRERLVALLAGFFGLFALLLAMLGLYGLMAYAVTRRTREIGVRMALGARAGDVLWLVLRETLLLVFIGIAIGLPVALAVTRLTKGLLFGLAPTDPLTITLATLAMIAVAALAGYLPARRAARINPIVALRNE
jgi:putative ABC transport system permease protein